MLRLGQTTAHDLRLQQVREQLDYNPSSNDVDTILNVEIYPVRVTA